MRCLDCQSEMVLINQTLWACWDCFGRHTAEQNVENLVTRAALGIVREPISDLKVAA